MFFISHDIKGPDGCQCKVGVSKEKYTPLDILGTIKHVHCTATNEELPSTDGEYLFVVKSHATTPSNLAYLNFDSSFLNEDGSDDWISSLGFIISMLDYELMSRLSYS